MQTIYQENNNLEGRRSVSNRRVSADSNYRGIENRVTGDRRKGTRKREQTRFRAKEGTYAAIISDYIIGLIKDISKGGLSFQYIANGKELNGLLTIDIFSNGKSFYLKAVPFKTITDFYVDNKVPYSTIMLRQCCGKFADLSDNQISQLDRFIENHTLGEA